MGQGNTKNFNRAKGTLFVPKTEAEVNAKNDPYDFKGWAKPRNNTTQGDIANTIRYPFENAISADTDYVSVDFFNYQPPFGKGEDGSHSTDNGVGGQGQIYSNYHSSIGEQSLTENPATGYKSILLFMPEDVNTQYGANWGGVGTGVQEFVFSTDGSTFNQYLGTAFTQFADRAYRFDTSDASMSGRDFKLSLTINGEWGPDGTAGNSDDGVEYTDGRTASGTPGSGGAHVTFDLTIGNPAATLYIYDGTTGTAANSSYGGSDRLITISATYEYTSFWVYDIEGSWTNSTDTFTFNGVTYTVTGQTTSAYGYVRDYTGTSLKVVKGKNSADFT